MFVSVMGYVTCARLWMTLMFGAILEIQFSEEIEVDRETCGAHNWGSCLDPTEITNDPDIIWDFFPCPPPWKKEIILHLPWIRNLGEVDGKRLSERVARRCGLDLESLSKPPTPGPHSLIFKDCDINCFLLVIAAFICTVFLFVAAIAFHLKRRQARRFKTTKETGVTVARQYSDEDDARFSEVILANGGVTTQLLDSGDERSNPYHYPKYYGQLGDVQTPRGGNIYEKDYGGRQVKQSSEETSLSYSGTDTTHTYESIRGSVNSGSFRLSDAFPKYLLDEKFLISDQVNNVSTETEENVTTPVEDIYSSERFNDYKVSEQQTLPRRKCSCPRCSKTSLLYNGYPTIGRQCSCSRCSQTNLSPGMVTGYGSDGYTDYGSYSIRPQRQMGPGTDNEMPNRKRYRRRQNSEPYSEGNYVREEIDHSMISPNNSGVVPQSVTPAYSNDRGVYNTGEYSQECNCRRCVQNRSGFSDEEQYFVYSPNSGGSEIYGIPQTRPYNTSTMRSGTCNCRRCSRTSIDKSYNSEWTEQRMIVPGIVNDFGTSTQTNAYEGISDHRKRKRNKNARPISLNSSSDNNTGSEKSFRTGVPKTNGSLFNSKFANR